jgi:hypothetical protein
MPHFVVDGTPILDLLGPDYTLIQFNATLDTSAFLAECRAANVPMAFVAADRPPDTTAFTHDLVIVRFDQHVAWRGNSPPDPSAIIDVLRGARDVAGGRSH